MGFAVDLDFVAATVICIAVFHGTAGLHPHFTFFHSIGKEQGMMLAVTFERLCIQTPAEVVCIDNPVFAFSFETSAFGKEYEVLLNSRLL